MVVTFTRYVRCCGCRCGSVAPVFQELIHSGWPGVAVYRDVLHCMHHVNMEQPFSVRFPHTVCATKGGEGEADVLGKAHGDPERG